MRLYRGQGNSHQFILTFFSGVAPQGKLSPFCFCFSYLPAGPAPALTARALDFFFQGDRPGARPPWKQFFSNAAGLAVRLYRGTLTIFFLPVSVG